MTEKGKTNGEKVINCHCDILSKLNVKLNQMRPKKPIPVPQQRREKPAGEAEWIARSPVDLTA